MPIKTPRRAAITLPGTAIDSACVAMSQPIVHTPVSACMTASVITVGPYASLAEAWQTMSDKQIRRLPVIEDGRLLGIITQSDILNAKPSDPARRMNLADVAAQLDKLVVSVVMTREPVCVFANDTVGHAAELMLEHKIGGLPVLDTQRQLCGVITESNIFRLLARQWREDNAVFSGAR